MIVTNKDEIISFLRGIGKDYLGRTHEDIISCTSEEMERCHSQIQQIFPLHEESKHASTYPIITPEIVAESKKYPEINKNLLKALDIMRCFYGVGEARDYFVAPELVYNMWCKNGDHNLLRITRIIRSLRLFGLDTHANDFYNEVMEVAKERNISEATLNYWKKANENDIWETLR